MTTIRSRESKEVDIISGLRCVEQISKMLYNNGDVEASVRYIRGFLQGLMWAKAIEYGSAILYEGLGCVKVTIEIEYYLHAGNEQHYTIQIR